MLNRETLSEIITDVGEREGERNLYSHLNVLSFTHSSVAGD